MFSSKNFHHINQAKLLRSESESCQNIPMLRVTWNVKSSK